MLDSDQDMAQITQASTYAVSCSYICYPWVNATSVPGQFYALSIMSG